MNADKLDCEVEALVAGARMVEAWGWPELAQFSRSALAEIAGVLPPARRDELERPRLFALNFRADPAVAETLEIIRREIARRKPRRPCPLAPGEGRARVRVLYSIYEK
jgi:predicted DNA-binding transcriptional regulator YafY